MGTAVRGETDSGSNLCIPLASQGILPGCPLTCCHSIRIREFRTGLEDNLLFCVRLRSFYTQLFYEWNTEAKT